MNCNQSRGLLSAWVDGQLNPADRAEIEEHLQECAECRIAAECTRDLHDDLVRAFESPRAAAARAAEQVALAIPSVAPPAPLGAATVHDFSGIRQNSGIEDDRNSGEFRYQRDLPGFHTTPAPLAVTARSPNWISLGLALALGFLMALLVFPPGKSWQVAPEFREAPRDGLAGMPLTRAATMTAAPVARLVVATGPDGVECDDRTRGAWQSVATLSPFQCPSEGAIRTNENVRCELVTSDGCVVRMNRDTEIVFHSAGCVELKRGEIWCRSTPQAPLEVLPSPSTDVVDHAAPTKAASQWSCTAADATCLMCVTESGDKVRVTAAAGNISVKARHESLQLGPSETATITRERIDRDRSPDRLLAASWMQPLLILKGHGDRELAERVGALLAQIGESNQSELYEAEIRSLGEYAVLPLLRYVESPHSGSDGERRLVAMRIVSDLAPPWAIGDLIGLLNDADADMRFLSATALERLTKQTQGAPTETWRRDRAAWEPALAAWQIWWSKNRDRYPMHFDASPLSIPTQ